MKYAEDYLNETREILDRLDRTKIEELVEGLLELRRREGRLFFLGVGGGAALASHAVNDFRKIAGIEAYAPADNVSELTARTNDDGWETVFKEWLKGSRLGPCDGVFVFSVGGGNVEAGVSVNIVEALKYAREVGAKIFGIVGRDGGYTASAADAAVIVPTADPARVTPHTEAFQAVLLHLIVSHPGLQVHKTK